jgi:hypothetical protein
MEPKEELLLFMLMICNIGRTQKIVDALINKMKETKR